MTDVPLTGSALEIQRRLEAGQDIDFVAHVGWYLAAWSREDVLAVDIYRRELARAQEAEDDRIASAEHLRAVTRPECGTPNGAQKHVRKHERLCEPCRLARNEYQKSRRRAQEVPNGSVA